MHTFSLLLLYSIHFIILSISTFFFLCSTTDDYILKAIPKISQEYEEQAEKLTSTFTGDPSFFAFTGGEEEVEPVDEEVWDGCMCGYICADVGMSIH